MVQVCILKSNAGKERYIHKGIYTKSQLTAQCAREETLNPNVGGIGLMMGVSRPMA